MKKVFFAFELPANQGEDDQREQIFREVFSGWDIQTGNFGPQLMGGQTLVHTLKETLRHRLCIFDFTGKKRLEDGGINLNVLLEFGLGYGAEAKCYGLMDRERYRKTIEVEKRISDLMGCFIYRYGSQEEFRTWLESFKANYEQPGNLTADAFRKLEVPGKPASIVSLVRSYLGI